MLVVGEAAHLEQPLVLEVEGAVHVTLGTVLDGQAQVVLDGLVLDFFLLPLHYSLIIGGKASTLCIRNFDEVGSV